MDAAAERHPEVPYEPVLIDATYAGLVSGAADGPLVIPTLNRDGDLLSDLVMPMFGSIAGAESILLSLDDDLRAAVAMAEAPHGTAPSLVGKDIANPMAMILACAAVLHYAAERGHAGAEARLARRSTRRRSSAAGDGIRTHDLGGEASTSEVCDEVVERALPRTPEAGRPPAQTGRRHRRRPAPGASSTRRHSTIFPSSISNEVEAVAPAPGRSRRRGARRAGRWRWSARRRSRAETSSAPQGSDRLKAIASASWSRSGPAAAPFSAVLGIAK